MDVAEKAEQGKNAKSLREADFMDVYISETGNIFFRGADGREMLVANPSPRLVADLENLHKRVCSIGEKQCEFFLDYDSMRFRVSRMDSVDENWYVLRRAIWPIPRLTHLDGIHNKVIEYLGMLGRPGKSGLILISGAPANGKTTTACSLLQEYLVWHGDIAVTLEDPVELPMSGPHGAHGHCFQVPVRDGDFSLALKRSMRHSPRYIFVGEVRSASEAANVLKASINGHIVISTIHAGSAIDTVNSILKYAVGVEPAEMSRAILADGLLGVINQRLLHTQVRGVSRRHIKAEYFFPGDDKGLRSLIRNGKSEQLTTAIEMQMRRVEQGLLPVEAG